MNSRSLPEVLHSSKLNNYEIEQLRVFPFLISDSVIHELKTELPKYIAASHNVASTVDRKEWWKRNSDILPSWSNACKSVLLIQPSSAAAERCFSILSNSFTQNHQEHSHLLCYNIILETKFLYCYMYWCLLITSC